MFVLASGAAACGAGGSASAPEETTTTLAELTLAQTRLDLKDAGCEAEGAEGRYGGMGQLGIRVYKDKLSTCGRAIEDALVSLGFNDRQMADLALSLQPSRRA